MIHGVDPRVDYAFKRLFGSERNRDLLISLVNAVLEGSGRAPIVEVEILNPFTPQAKQTGKLSVVDIKARDQLGRRFIIEMQILVHRDVPQRLVYYLAKGYVEQLSTGDDYIDLAPTILICFLDEPLDRGTAPYHRTFDFRCRETGAVFTSDLELHTIELSKLPEALPGGSRPLDAWSYFLRHAEQLDDEALPEALAKREIQRAMEELAMIRRSDSEWLEYESHLMSLRDERARLRDSRAAGRAEGVLIGRVQNLQSLLKIPVSTEDELARLTAAQLQAMADDLTRLVESRFQKTSP